MDQRAALLRLYQDVEEATGAFQKGQPLSRCDPGCADCCRSKPPLVSRQEAMLVRDAVAALPEETRDGVRRRARASALQLAQGRRADFVCPLLLEGPEGGRCAVYQDRPYTCRTFGHTARVADDAAAPQPFTCGRLHARVGRFQPPPVPFRSEAVREVVGSVLLEDSYLPVWVGLDPDEWFTVETGPQSRVVVGRPRELR